LLYTLVARTHVPKKLEFVDTISAAVYAAWLDVMTGAMAEAMRTAR
jgi:hypothetical protein